MPSNNLTAEAKRENAVALAAALGVGLEEAAETLDVDVAITADGSDKMAQQVACEISDLLSRTVRIAPPESQGTAAAAELVIGRVAPRTTANKVYLSISTDRAVVRRNAGAAEVCSNIPNIFGLLVACYASAVTLQRALGDILPFSIPDPLVIPFDQLGIDLVSLTEPIDIGRTYMAGAGAIGNGLLWAARHLNLRGRLDIVDDDNVSSGNLNRQVWFEAADIGSAKVDCLSKRARPFFPNLSLVPRPCRLQDLPERSGAWLRRLIVAVDSRRARRGLQNEFPREVFDASTTDIREIVLHYHAQPTGNACLSCIYEPDEEEVTREQHIAEHLGVSVDDVRSQRISASVAQTIVTRFPTLVATELVSMAYDTLFKRLCAEQQLRTTTGRTVVAPFAFVSVLAGTLLALEVVRRLGTGGSAENFNYWRLSPWHPPIARRRSLRPKQPACTFCGRPLLEKINRDLWG